MDLLVTGAIVPRRTVCAQERGPHRPLAVDGAVAGALLTTPFDMTSRAAALHRRMAPCAHSRQRGDQRRSGNESVARYPVWSRSGDRIAFASVRTGSVQLPVRPSAAKRDDDGGADDGFFINVEAEANPRPITFVMNWKPSTQQSSSMRLPLPSRRADSAPRGDGQPAVTRREARHVVFSMA